MLFSVCILVKGLGSSQLNICERGHSSITFSFPWLHNDQKKEFLSQSPGWNFLEGIF
jgi:hypothetical protein